MPLHPPRPAEWKSRLAALWRAGVPAKAIAAELGVPPRLVYLYRLRLDLPRRNVPTPRPDPITARRFAAAWAAGTLGKVLAHDFGLSKNQVTGWVRHLGLPPRVHRHAYRRAA